FGWFVGVFCCFCFLFFLVWVLLLWVVVVVGFVGLDGWWGVWLAVFGVVWGGRCCGGWGFVFVVWVLGVVVVGAVR
ncbi:hypothetical protein RA274_27810, partial [Pseudomonas syringae pv. tagetis]|uniref:hypothetical protein n=1 Tax=Pseudomonas syringae group genomosp. 7 TaxID=251699 RepID=UPI00377048CF